MSLSDNIKRMRREKNLTQEQLAARLGVSAQAVSKWETSETYPDGTLLVPLAKELGVSLDTLFDHDAVNMADISGRIMKLLYEADEKDRFQIARDIGWQIERGLFNCRMKIESQYDPDEIKNQKNASYVLDDYGFTLISNGKEPFFSVFPQPEEGFGNFLSDEEELRKIFSALADEDTMKALIYLYRLPEHYVFESAVLSKECGIAAEKTETVLEHLIRLKLLWKQPLTINGEARVVYDSVPSHKLIAVFLMAREIGFKGGYSLQSHYRNTPLLSE